LGALDLYEAAIARKAIRRGSQTLYKRMFNEPHILDREAGKLAKSELGNGFLLSPPAHCRGFRNYGRNTREAFSKKLKTEILAVSRLSSFCCSKCISTP
jgi:hypothetical protein